MMDTEKVVMKTFREASNMTDKKRDINITQAVLPEIESYFEQLKTVWESHWMTSKGQLHQELENKLKAYLGVEHASLFVNGHLALESILEAYELKGEIITTPFTFPSTAHAIIRKGCTPVFCDIKEVDYTLDETKLEALITPKTVAILPVHVLGNVCQVEAIETIAKKHNLKVIYDSAHVFGVKVNGVGIGNFGDANMFSMNATKIFNTIEGGLVTYRDPELTRKLELIKYYGMEGHEDIVYPGSNLKMNEFQAAMGLCNLPLLENEIAQRKALATLYSLKLKDVPGIILPEYSKDIEYNYIYYPIRLSDPKLNRDTVDRLLNQAGIHSRKYFYPLVQDYACYADRHTSKDTPVAQMIANQILCLPLFGDMSAEVVNHIHALIGSLTD